MSVTAMLAKVRAQDALGFTLGLCVDRGITSLRGNGQLPKVTPAMSRDCQALAPASKLHVKLDSLVGFFGSWGWPHRRMTFPELSTFRYYECASSDLGIIPREANLAGGTFGSFRLVITKGGSLRVASYLGFQCYRECSLGGPPLL